MASTKKVVMRGIGMGSKEFATMMQEIGLRALQELLYENNEWHHPPEHMTGNV